ncbi:hypothetical protein GCM10009839_18000 [Catenulispora yoronensis]|uniref:Uncharacterized protein n=1 Tax=Catenulispora yoronensis TaxID=450799 RepID=A0ABP5FC20_9ACTN
MQSTDILQRPRFSPDGKHLSFLAGDALYVADPDGSNATKVAVTPAAGETVSFGDYEWSADSASLYISLTPGIDQNPQLAEVRPDGSGLHSFGPSTSPYGFSVATRTGEIGFPSGQKYVIFDPTTGTTRTIPWQGAGITALSPDGKYVAYLTKGAMDGEEDINVQPADGSPGWTALPWVYYNQYLPAWSPDESQLAYESAANLGAGSGVRVTVGSSSGHGPALVNIPVNTGSGTLFGTLGESPSWVPLPAGAPLHPPTDGVVHPVVGPKVYRDAGGDRVQTGIAISKQRWTASGSAKAVVLATSLNFPDALSGGPLAAKKGGPLLLTDGSAGQLDPRVLAEIQRVLPHGGAVHVLGGDKAVNPSIVAQLKSLGYAVVQYKGADRADTALRVARDGMGSPQHVVVATGAGFADALAAGPYAAGPFADASGAPGAIVLSNGAALDPATAAFLKGKTVATVGAQAGKAWPTAVKSFSGTDRFDTAARVAREFTGVFANTQVGVANGIASTKNPGYPDALTGGAYMAESNGPIVLVDGIANIVPETTRSILSARTGDSRADIFGGESIISPSLAASIVSLLHGTAQF